MPIHEHVREFAGRPVREYDPDEGIVDPVGAAQRLAQPYDDAMTFAERLARFLDDPAARQVEAIVVGPWWRVDYTDPSEVVAGLTAARDRLPALRALFVGDIIGEECEISWIQQEDVTPLLDAFPRLEHFRVRGGTGLELRPDSHDGLRSLVIESGGLPAEVVRSVAAARLPRLEHLEFWLGEENYGGDVTVEDLAPILAGEAFPELRSLGLRDSETADALAAALAEAPVLRRIEVLDLSLGNLGDEGALALLKGGALPGLKRLDIHHHYVSDEVLDGLKALGIDLNADDRKEPDKDGAVEYRYIAVSE